MGRKLQARQSPICRRFPSASLAGACGLGIRGCEQFEPRWLLTAIDPKEREGAGRERQLLGLPIAAHNPIR